MTIARQTLHAALVSLLQAERRVSPLVRPRWNSLFRAPSAAAIQFLISQRRTIRESLGLAQERAILGEEAFLDSILHDMGELLTRGPGPDSERPGDLEGSGHIKSHGAVRAELSVRHDVPAAMQRGLFARPRTYRAWVQFSTHGGAQARDLDLLGPLGMNIKLLGVPGPKLLDDERQTHDLIASSVPTGATPDVRADAELQGELLRGTPLFYFFNRKEPRILEFLMQLLWNHTQTSPLECDYFSGAPYLLGEGQAMKFTLRSRLQTRSRIPRLLRGPSPHYLRENMARTLSNEAVEFDLLLQVQTDPHRMPIEDSTVMWPEHMSPHVPVAVLRIPQQTFDSPGQLAFAESLQFNPWHAIPAHRPLGNQNRARRRTYWELLRLRQSQNAEPPCEPTGDEVFDISMPSGPGGRAAWARPHKNGGAGELRPRLH
ncbi:MAG: hypothetical protein QM778_23405 [Myxococcales bacterium]